MEQEAFKKTDAVNTQAELTINDEMLSDVLKLCYKNGWTGNATLIIQTSNGIECESTTAPSAHYNF